MKKYADEVQLQNKAKQNLPIPDKEKLAKPPLKKESIPEPPRPLIELQNSSHKRLEK
jgi:hypothetical protein